MMNKIILYDFKRNMVKTSYLNGKVSVFQTSVHKYRNVERFIIESSALNHELYNVIFYKYKKQKKKKKLAFVSQHAHLRNKRIFHTKVHTLIRMYRRVLYFAFFQEITISKMLKNSCSLQTLEVLLCTEVALLFLTSIRFFFHLL